MAEVWRGGFLECVHLGHAVIADASGGVVRSWGEPELVVLPRSSIKMIQALPLVESGAELTTEQLALACASHQGAPMHTDRVTRWLSDLGLAESDLRCGPQAPAEDDDYDRLVREGRKPGQVHNNCSGKHTGFLMLG
jgi:L-asparaginase II